MATTPHSSTATAAFLSLFNLPSVPAGEPVFCRFSRNHAQVTPKIICFYYQKKHFFRIKVSKNSNHLILKEINHWGERSSIGDHSDFVSADVLVRSTQKNIYFQYLKKCFVDQSIQKMYYFIFKADLLVGMVFQSISMNLNYCNAAPIGYRVR